MSSHDDERLRAELAAVSLSRPRVGIDDVMRRAAAERRSRRGLVRMAMAGAAVWALVWIAQAVVERGMARAVQGPAMSSVVATVERGAAEPTTAWLVWQRRLAEGLVTEDLGTDIEAPRKARPKDDGGSGSDQQGMRRNGGRDQAERCARRRAHV